MSCRRYEEWLALEVGSDLPPEKDAELSSHLRGCGDCRRAAEELNTSQAALRALHRSPVAEQRLDAVRAAVLAELRTGSALSARRRWVVPQWLAPRWAVVGLVITLAVTIAFWNSRSADSDHQEKVMASQPAIPSASSELREETEQPILPPDEERDAEKTVSVEQPAAQPALPPRHEEAEEQPIRAATPAAAITVVSLPEADTGDTEGNQDAVLQVASSDPDITIYWLVGRNGE